MTARLPRLASARVLRGVLWLQLGFAALLFGNDMRAALPNLGLPSTAPRLTEPVRPGDQTRRYDPADVPRRAPGPNTSPLPPTDDMPTRLTFDTVTQDGQTRLTLTGAIAPGDAARLTEYLATTAAPDVVALNSPGGSVGDALTIGRDLRARGVATAMADSDVCLSACPYILAAGVTRDIAAGAWVGVHQHYFDASTVLPAFLAVEDIQRGQAEVVDYLDAMGIDLRLMAKALATPPDEIYLLTPEELVEYGFLTAPEPAAD